MKALSCGLAVGAACAIVASAAPTPLVRFSEASTWATIDVDKLKGRPAQLAWSDDEAELYLQVVQGVTVESLKVRHYLLKMNAEPAPIDRQPIWAQVYWKWKSARSFFGDPLLTIAVDTTRAVVDEPRDRNTAYLNSERKAPATLQSKAGTVRTVNRLLLRGHVIGEFVDEEIFPGYTFSWSPESLGMIVFRSSGGGRLMIMNAEGDTQTIEDGKDISLPAWSESGNAIAYLEPAGRKKFALKVMTAL
jgi:hypothetical protein